MNKFQLGAAFFLSYLKYLESKPNGIDNAITYCYE